MGMDGMKNKCAVGIYKIEKKNVDAIDQRERRMEKMRLLLIHVVLLSVLLVGGSIGAKPVQAAEANPVDIENAQIIHKNDSYLAKVPKVQIDKVSYKAGTDDVGTSDSDSMQQDLLSDLPLSDIQDVLQENTDTENIYFRELVKSLMLADANTDKQELFRQILRSAFGDVEEGRQVFVQILLLTAACAFLQNFINVFENSQISKTGFYLYFLLLMGLLLRSYLLIHGILEGVLDQVISFMEALLPAFCMTMVFCSQQVAAVGFYQLSLIVIYLIERVLLYVVIPAIHVYVVLQMLNCMTAGKLISRMTALLKRGLIWVMRLLLAGVTGMNVIERMIAPSVDNLKKMSVTQTISMIPGLGNTAQAVGNIFFGSAAVIRNGIGTAAMIVLLCLAIGPLLKMLIFSVFYKMAGALAEPFSDKRICGCIDCVGDGALLLFRALGTGILLCMITIAVVVTATV
jgi:stage III sporulation protein AE